MGRKLEGFGHHQLGIPDWVTLLQPWNQLQQREEQGQRTRVVQAGQWDESQISWAQGTTSQHIKVAALYRSTHSARKLFVWVGMTDLSFPVLTETPERSISA